MRFIRFSVIVLFCAACSMLYAQDPTYVDLGLSVKWSTVNTGTTTERPYGWYYRWPDAMAIKTTDGSRMGTKAEWDELREYCTWKWTRKNGLSGYLVTSKIKGFTDKSIFLPAAGWLQDGKIMQDGEYASYWCSTPGIQPDNEAAYGFNFKRGADEWHSENRESEQSVRMVMPLSGKEVSKITLEKNNLSLLQGTGARLNVTMGKRDVNSACIWKSSDENVIKVIYDGLLVAAGPGSCKVTVTAYGKTAECSVTVKPHEYEYVDLGLSVLWATANLGASAPQGYGDYYAWAEVEPKEFFSWGNYRYSSFVQDNGMDKYTADGQSHQHLKADNLDRLEPTDDAATVLLGDGWHIPTIDEFAELVSNCTYDTVIVDGARGMRFTSNVPGFEGRSIFIPYSGRMNGDEPMDRGKQLSLWTSTAGNGRNGSCFSTIGTVNGMMGSLSEMSPIEVLRMAFEYTPNGRENRFIGLNIRPVRSLTDDMFTSLSLSAENLDLNYGEIHNIEAVMMPSGRPIKPSSVIWGSSAPDIVATNGDGSVTALGQGECIITAESEGRKAQMKVKVTLPVPEAVDLGLSVKWASANLGAADSSEAGGYFAWGETAPKAGVYDGRNYKFGEYTNQMTKYNFYTVLDPTLRSLTTITPVDCKLTLDPEDDAAAVLLGGGWRMPTADELWELKTKCTWTPVTTVIDSTEFFVERRLEGYVITSNVPGYEGNSIFLPSAGYISDYISFSNGGLVSNKGAELCYWTATLEQSIGGDRRWHGYTIRPVLDDNTSGNRPAIAPDPVKPPKRNVMVDLGLSVLWADCNVGAESPEGAGARFAWGETAPKTYYSDYNYKYMKNYDNMYWWYFKYSVGDEYSEAPFLDGKKRLEFADDAARANWGGKWRTPTKEEFVELFEKCEWTETTVNGVMGFLVTSKVPGYTSNSIFLPYHCPDDVIEDSWRDNMSYYLTSELASRGSNQCVMLLISEDEVGTMDEVDLGLERMTKIHITSRERSGGYRLRAVCEK